MLKRLRSTIFVCTIVTIGTAGCSSEVGGYIVAGADAGPVTMNGESAKASEGSETSSGAGRDEGNSEVGSAADDDGTGSPPMSTPVIATSAGATDSPAQMGTMTPAPGESTTPVAEVACDAPNALRCSAVDSMARELCQAGQWVAHDSCNAGRVCYGAEAECIAEDEFCKGNPGKNVCVEGVLHQCDGSARSAGSENCGHPERCRLGLESGTCASCLPGQDFQCDGEKLLVCNQSGTGYALKETCSSIALCNVDAGSCTPAACMPDQVRCEGQNLLRCNADQSAFTTVMTCPGGSDCDAAGEQCDVCTVGETKCEGGARQTCSADGSSFTASPCTGSTPHCKSPGQCVACTEDSHCEANAGSCQKATCNTSSGTCELAIGEGMPCTRASGPGVCANTGSCVECNTASDCTGRVGRQECNNNVCRRIPTCGDGVLDELNPNAELCDDGNTANGDACSSDCKTASNYGPCTPDGDAPGIFSISSDCNYEQSRCTHACFSFCGPSAPCPRIPSSTTGDPADDRWVAECVIADAATSAGFCFIGCRDGARACPVGYECVADDRGTRSCVIPGP